MVQGLPSATDLDPLTGILHRRAFIAYLESALLGASPEQPVSLLQVDLDHLKRVNADYLHTGGDHVLRHVATLLPVAEGVVAGRVGGEEFVLSVSGLDEGASLDYADKLREIISTHPTVYNGLKIVVTVSIGVSTTETPVTALTDIFMQADSAMYAAKVAGRNRAMHYRALEREALRTGVDVRIRTFEAMQRVVTEKVEKFIAQRRRQLLTALQDQADRDGLTGLFNRGYLDRRLALDHQQFSGSSRSLCVALIDVDHFGSINKLRGWPTGDQTLRGIADLIRQHVRGSDWVARYGGEEIAVILPEVSQEEAFQVIERVRVAVAGHHFRDLSNGESFSVTISAGVVQLQPGEQILALWQRLSNKLLEAKGAGRNRVWG